MGPANRPSRILGSNSGLRVSFEFFPPKTEAMEETLWRAIERLGAVLPSFVWGTHGAGGPRPARAPPPPPSPPPPTSPPPAAHLTCVAATRDEVDGVVRAYADAGVRHIVALRGDPVGGNGAAYQPHPGGYENAAALVAGIGAAGDFEISVAAYPEKHPESPSL